MDDEPRRDRRPPILMSLQRQVFVEPQSPTDFADLMRSIPPHSEVVLLPGVHETYGFSFDKGLAQRSWLLKGGWRFRGCGRGNTTLRLADVKQDGDNRHIMLTNTAGGSFDDFIEVSDLTIDMNWDGQDYKEGMMSACHLWGSHVRASNLRVINFGNKTKEHENFLVAVGASWHGVKVLDAVIEHCIAELPAWIGTDSAGVLPFQLFGSPHPSLTFQNAIRHCTVDGQYPDGTVANYNPLKGQTEFKDGRAGMIAFGPGNGQQFVYEYNTVLNCFSGFHLDTGNKECGGDFTIRGNRIHGAYQGIGLHYKDPTWQWGRAVIEDNDISLVRITKDGKPLEPASDKPIGIVFTAHVVKDDPPRGPGVREVIVRNNRIQLVDGDLGSLNKALAGIYVDYAKIAVIEDNFVRLPHCTMITNNPAQSICTANVASVRSRNNLRPENGSIISPWRMT